MRTAFVALIVLLSAACTVSADRPQVVYACWRGDSAACADRSLREQAELDANAIMMGMQTSSLHAASTQGRAR